VVTRSCTFLLPRMWSLDTATLSPDSLLGMRISGPISDLMNQSLHFNKVPGEPCMHIQVQEALL
jgi:hypothetical protein